MSDQCKCSVHIKAPKRERGSADPLYVAGKLEVGHCPLHKAAGTMLEADVSAWVTAHNAIAAAKKEEHRA